MAADSKEFYKKLWHLTLPFSFQSLMLASVAAADALMLGNVDQNEMAAVSLATQIQFIQNMFIWAVTGAGSILGAQYWGKKDKKTVEDLLHIMLRFAGAVSLVFFAGCELIPESLMRIFTHDGVLIGIGAEYLRIAGWSYLLTGVSQCYLTVMKVTDRAAPSAWISSSAVVLNILFNSLFIFGIPGALAPMNARGAATATTLARWIELSLCLIVSQTPGYLRPVWRRLFARQKQLEGDFMRQCLPLMGGALFWGVGFTSYTAIIGHMEKDAAAANAVAAVVRDLICCVCDGMGNSARVIVGNELGAGNLETGKKYGLRLTNISYIVGFSSTLIVLALTPVLTHLVKLTDTARGYLTGMMIVMAVYMIGRCVNTVTINGVLDGGGDTVFDMYSLAVCMWGVAIPLALLGAFVLNWPVVAVYACTCLDEVGKIPWVMVRLKKFKWVRNLTR